MQRLDEGYRLDAQVAASRIETGQPDVSLLGGSVQPGSDATIIGLMRQESVQNLGNQEKWLENSLLAPEKQ